MAVAMAAIVIAVKGKEEAKKAKRAKTAKSFRPFCLFCFPRSIPSKDSLGKCVPPSGEGLLI
jgi:hypothetical protein